MNVRIKKLLSMLLVVAMVVSMIVPVNFSTVLAEEAPATTSVIPEAAQAEIAKAKTVKELSEEVKDIFQGPVGEDGTVTAKCPVCGEDKVWYAVTNAINLGTSGVAMNGAHFYLAEDIVNDTYASGYNGFFMGSGCINLNGKNVTLSNGGRFLYIDGTNTANVIDTAGGAVITGSYDALKYDNGYSATIRVNAASSVLNLYGGTYTRMADIETETENEIPTAGIRGGTLNLFDGATIVGADGTDGNKAIYGGALYVNNANSGTFNMYGGVIRDGKSTQAGNIYVKGVMNMYGGQIKNGVATGTDHCGGNMYIANGATFNMYGGEMLGGSAKYGGSIYLQSTSATGFGTMNMYGGFIAGGTSTKGDDYGHNVYLGAFGSGTSTTTAAVFNMAGGTLVGYLATSPNYGGSGTTKKHTATFSGTARLVPYGVDSEGNEYSATTTLSKVTFSSANITAGGMLFGGALDKAYGYCQDCGKASVAYTVVTAPTELTSTNKINHVIFLGGELDYTFETPDSASSLLKTSNGKACIELNGADIKIHKGRFLTVNSAGTVNVRDSVGGAEIAGSFDWFTGNGRVIQTTDLSEGKASVLNLYGGTYKGFVYEGDAANTTYDAETGAVTKAGTKNATALIRVRNRATVNLFEGATVDGSSIEQKVAAVFVGNAANTPSTFNLEGGTVIGTKNASSDGDAVRLGNNANSATLNVNSGKIIGAGGIAVNVRSGSVLNVTGGSITNEKGAGVNCYQTNTISVSGGEVSTLNVTSGSTLTLSGKPVIGVLYTNGVLANVDGLSNEADITVAAAAGTVLTAATETDIGNAIKHSNKELLIKKNADGQYVVANAFADPVEGTFDPENCGGYAYCPVCGEKVKWTAISEPTEMEGGHYYLADHIDYNFNNDSDNNFLTGHGTINLNGKNVTINAGRFISAGAGVTNIIDTEGDAVIIGSNDRYDNNGATISVNNAEAVLNVRGGTYMGADDTLAEDATDTTTTGSMVRVRLGELNLYDGAVIDGEGYDKVGNYSLVYIGHSSGDQAFNMYGGIIKNGTSEQYGGNVYIRQGKTFNMEGGAILNGTAKQGGNVYVASDATAGGTFNMKGGFIGGGTATSGAGNYGSNVGLQTHKNTDGTYVNNTTFSMTGGTIVGGVAVCWGQNLANKTFTITGTAKVVPEAQFEGETYTETVGLCKVSFDSSEAEKGYEVWVGQALANTYTWCDHCDKIVKINNLYKNATPVAETEGHYRFMEDVTYTYEANGDNSFFNITGRTYIDLNGCDVTIDGGRFIVMNGASEATVVDTKGGAIVTGSNNYYSGGGLTLHVNKEGAFLNLKGGTFRGMDDTNNEVSGNNGEKNDTPVVRMRAGGTINLFEGATIDGSTLGADRAVGTIYVGYKGTLSTFNIKGGTVIGTANTTSIDAIRVGSGNEGDAVLNMESGSIVGAGGVAVQVRTGATANISGGSITLANGKGGALGSFGGNLTMNISGGNLATVNAVSGSTLILSGAPVIGMLYTNGNLANVDNLSVDADITVSAGAGTILTAPTTNEIGAAIKHANSEMSIKKNADGQYVISYDYDEPVEGVFAPENCGGYAYCPICGTKEKWTAIDSKTEIKDKATVITMDEEHDHYYFAENLKINYSYALGGFINGSGCLNLNGKTITLNGAKLVDLGAGYTMNIIDTKGGAVVTGSCDYYGNDGKVLRVNTTGATLNLYGGTFMAMNDTYSAYTNNDKVIVDTDHSNGSATVAVRGGVLNMYDGATIVGVDGAEGNTSKNGGAVYINADAKNKVAGTFNMYGGTIRDGIASSYGGNIYVSVSDATYFGTFNMHGGEILNGEASRGGNVFINTTATAGAVMTMDGGFIAGGKVPNSGAFGANVCLATVKDESNAAASNVTFTMTDGTIVGGVVYAWAVDNQKNLPVNVSGKAKIVPEAERNGVTYTGNYIGLVRASFDSSNTEEGFDVWTGQTCATSYTYCPECKDVVKWTSLTAPNAKLSGHYRLVKDIEYTYDTYAGGNSYLTISGNTCLDLNGKDLRVIKGRVLTHQVEAVVNILDMAGGAVVAGSNDFWSGNARTLQLNSGKAVLNLKGGTYKGIEDNDENTDNAATIVRVRSGELNIYAGATIDGSDMTEGCATALYIGKSGQSAGIVNLVGGSVYGGTNTAGDGGAVRLGDGEGTATLNVKSGFIKAGSAKTGNAIQVRVGNTLNVEGGLIVTHEDNISSSSLIYIQNGGITNISGGVIVGYIYQDNGGDVNLSGAPKIVTEYTDENDVTYYGSYGMRPRNGALFNVDGLTAEAEIVVTVDTYGAPLTEAYTGELDMSTVLKGNTAVFFQKNAENQYCAIRPAAGIGNVPYATVEEALEAYDISSGENIFFSGEAVINEDIIINAYTCDGAVISGNGTVYGYDSANWDYNGYSTVKITGNVKVAAEYNHNSDEEIHHYITLKEGEGLYSFHRVELDLSHVVLRTSAAGIYYMAEYKCDELVRDRVKAYGVALSVADMPGADFMDDATCKFTVMEDQFDTQYGAETAYTVKTTSGSLTGILKETRDQALNTQYLDVDVYANCYLMVDVDGNGDCKVFMSDTENGGKKTSDEGFSGVAYNLLDVVKAVDASFVKLSESDKATMVSFVSKWSDYLDEAGKEKWAEATTNIVA